MKTQVILVLLLTTISTYTLAEAPEPIHQKILPGNALINTSKIYPHHIQYQKTGGLMEYQLELIKLDNRDTFELKIFFNRSENSKPDTIYFDAETLGYVGRHLDMQGYVIDVYFKEGLFSGVLDPKPHSNYKKVKYHKNYPHNAFEPAIINYFIAALPLEVGFKASLPVFDLNNGSQMFWSNVEVVAKEDITYQGNTVSAWKVKSDGIKKKTIWISDKYPFALKMKTKGSFGTWTVAD
ncbi:MAG: hypothetical protein R3E90_03725 [Marinicella sp.]